MYHILEENYPYFGVNKRIHHTDWLANKKVYENKIRNTKSDKEFYKTMAGILGDLHNGHTDFLPTLYYSYFLKTYSAATGRNAKYRHWVNELKKKSVKKHRTYWREMLGDKEIVAPTAEANNALPFTTKKFTDNVAYIKFESFVFNPGNSVAFGDSIRSFLSTIKNMPNLIIDIQGNEGGDSKMWSDSIVPFLLSSPLHTKEIVAYKNGRFIEKVEGKHRITFTDLEEKPAYPPELKNRNFVFSVKTDTIQPNKSVGYKGRIFLLVNSDVYSSSEMLAVFCKQTKWATVVGDTTGGDGIGSDPHLVSLPRTGLVFRFSAGMGLNPDGSANDETKTIPDILIPAKTRKERLEKLLELIEKKQI